MGKHYFQVRVAIKERAKLLAGIREFPTDDYYKVYYTVFDYLRKYYEEKEIQDVQITTKLKQ